MISNKNLRVLVVDDTIVYRTAVSEIIKEIPGVELVGVAHNGKIALAKIATLKPDILTLDIEMPVMNGLEVLAEIQKISSWYRGNHAFDTDGRRQRDDHAGSGTWGL